MRPPGLDQGPQRINQSGLLHSQLRDVAVALEPFAVGMPAYHPDPSARRIQQDAVKGNPVPPRAARCRITSVSRAYVGLQTKTGQIFGNAATAFGIDIEERGQLAIGQLGRCGLPPGAAQASSTRMPSFAPSSGAASWAPASCTENIPSRKPGSRSTGRGRLSTSMVSDSASASSLRSANAASSCWALLRLRLTRSVSGPWPLPPRRMASTSLAVQHEFAQPTTRVVPERLVALNSQPAPPRRAQIVAQHCIGEAFGTTIDGFTAATACDTMTMRRRLAV